MRVAAQKMADPARLVAQGPRPHARRAGTLAAARLYWDTTMLQGDVPHLLAHIHVPTLILPSAGCPGPGQNRVRGKEMYH
jgi:hypothetical protein